MPTPDPARLVRKYQEGRITETELHIQLIWAAVDLPPSSIAPALPAPILDLIREATASPPESPERAPRICRMAGYVGSHDRDAEIRREQRLWFDGAWRWFHHFQGA